MGKEAQPTLRSRLRENMDDFGPFAEMMALRIDRRNRRTRMRGDYAGTVQLRRVCGRRNGWMTLIVVERQRRIFRRHSHVLRLLRRRRHVLLTGGGNLLRRRPHRGTAGTAIIAQTALALQLGLP
jgi:hypothetical protein